MSGADSNATQLKSDVYIQLAEQRRHYDGMVWGTPVTTLTGLAFLFVIALGDGNIPGRIIASVLAAFVSVAAIHLLSKHRHFEKHYSELLELAEDARPKVHELHVPLKGWLNWSSFEIWKGLFWVFTAAAALNVLVVIAPFVL